MKNILLKWIYVLMASNMPAFCHMCGQRLAGTFYTYDTGLVVCARCNTTVPHCGLCNIPSRQLASVRGVQVCPACLHRLPVCACCGIPILKEYSTFDGSSVPYCQECMTTRPRCSICEVPINEQGKVITGQAETTYRCATCFSTAVTTQAEAKRLYEATGKLLQRELQLALPILPELHIVERAQLAKLHEHNSTLKAAGISPSEKPPHLQGFFRRFGEQQDIYIEQVLPRTRFQAVAAHELAHAWQSDNAPSSQPLTIIEGFAEWVAFHVLLLLGQQAEAARLTRRKDLYGEGLQYFLALEREHGRGGVLQRALGK